MVHDISGTVEWHDVRQWQFTIIILDMTVAGLRVMWWFAHTSIGDGAFLLLFSLAFAITLFMFCKDYLDLFVDLSKI